MERQDRWGLTGQQAIVTGAAMGIGFAIAAQLADCGANVLIVDRDEEAGEAAKAKLVGRPGRVAAIALDVAETDAGDRAVAKCIEEFGTVDILINNAGIFPMMPTLDMSADFLEHVLRVNLVGLILMSKAVGNQLRAQGSGGKIVNIASIDSLHPSMVGLAAYDSSKGGVLMFTKNFALEMAPYGVLVNAIAPGGIKTEGASMPMGSMTPEQMTSLTDQFIARIPLGRMGEPDDIAKVALFLASDAADYMTGSLITVDGGRLLM